MTIEVELPDGSIAEFPDGTPPEVMKAAIAKRFPKRETGGAPDGMTTAERIAKSKAGTLEVAPERLAAADAANAEAMKGMTPRRSVGQALYDNLIGDPNDGVNSYGEQAGEVINSFGSGIYRGIAGMADLPGQVVAGQANLVASGLEKAGVIGPDTSEGIRWAAARTPFGSGSTAREGIAALTGGASEYRGKSTPAKYAGTVGEFIPGALALGGGTASNLLRFGVVPGLASEAAGQATEGTKWEGPARIAGAIAGGVVPGLAAKGLAKMVSPYGGADPERLKLAQVLEDFGVPLTAGQKTGAKALMYKEGATAGGQRVLGEQQEAFTKAVLETAGIKAARATPEVLDEAATRIGSVFDDVTRGVAVVPDSASITALSKAVAEYKSLAPTANQAPLVSEVFKAVTNAFRGGNSVPASVVNTWRSGLSKLTTSTDAATRSAAQMALESVDDMLTASLKAAGRAEDVARLATARSQWRNFLAIQKAAVREGDGLLSPAKVRATVIQQGESAFARGKRGDLGTLARAGGEVMEALPNSGTAQRWFANIPGGATGLLSAGGATAGSAFGPLGIAGGALAGAALPGIARAIRMSRPVQNYLANQLANPMSARVGTGMATGLLPFAGETRNALAPR